MIVTDGPSGEVSSWLHDQEWTNPRRIRGGRNNRIFRVSGRSGDAALKIYYRGGEDSRDRYSHERAFYELANARGAAAPRWLASNDELGLSLLEWVEGVPVCVPPPRDSVLAAASFLNQVNATDALAAPGKMIASEARFSIAEHVALLSQRFAVLEDAASSSVVLRDFLFDCLQPALRHACDKLHKHRVADFSEWGGGRILSPGDFGLHNALCQPDGRVVFFDFEYAGWDDPAKTVADVFLQPEKPVRWELLGEFCQELRAWRNLENHVRAWIPFYAVKWAVILMNSACKDASRRRCFAGELADGEAVALQVDKAKGVLNHGRLSGE